MTKDQFDLTTFAFEVRDWLPSDICIHIEPWPPESSYGRLLLFRSPYATKSYSHVCLNENGDACFQESSQELANIVIAALDDSWDIARSLKTI